MTRNVFLKQPNACINCKRYFKLEDIRLEAQINSMDDIDHYKQKYIAA